MGAPFVRLKPCQKGRRDCLAASISLDPMADPGAAFKRCHTKRPFAVGRRAFLRPAVCGRAPEAALRSVSALGLGQGRGYGRLTEAGMAELLGEAGGA